MNRESSREPASSRHARRSTNVLCAAWLLSALSCASVFAQAVPPPPAAATAPAQAPASDQVTASFKAAFERRLDATATGFDGVMGYCIVDLTTGERFVRLGDQAFPTASSIKIAVLYELFVQSEQGRLRLDDARPLTAAARVGGSGILQQLESPALSLVDYATLMVMLSDNSATNLLIDTVGMEAVNRRMRELGLPRIWLQRRMIDLEAARQGRENLASPCDLAALVEAVHAGKGVSARSRDAMLEILEKPKSTPLTRSVPSGTRVASKPGGLDGVVVDAGVVRLQQRPYVVVAMANWLERTDEGEAAVEALSRTAYDYFSRLLAGGQYGRMIP
jgi:beta-lactamase class A